MVEMKRASPRAATYQKSTGRWVVDALQRRGGKKRTLASIKTRGETRILAAECFPRLKAAAAAGRFHTEFGALEAELKAQVRLVLTRRALKLKNERISPVEMPLPNDHLWRQTSRFRLVATRVNWPATHNCTCVLHFQALDIRA